MFETIVWATDGSELADDALEHVRKLAEIHGSRIVAVHANELLTGRFGGAPEPRCPRRSRLRGHLAFWPPRRRSRAAALTKLASAGCPVRLA